MNLQAIEYFIAVAEMRSFTKAAAACYVTQPALSRQITALEQTVGCRLLHRTTRSVELTQAGLAFLAHALRIQRACDELRSDMRRFETGMAGTLRVGFVTLGHVNYVTHAIGRLDAASAGVEVTVVRGNPPELKEALREGRIDCALLHTPSFADSGWAEGVRVVHAVMEARVAVGGPLDDGQPVTLARISGQPLVRNSRDTDPLSYDMISEAFAGAGLKTDISVTVFDQDAVSIHTAAGQGVAIVGSINPPWAGVVALPIADWNPDFDLHLVHRRHDDNPLIDLFCRALLNTLPK